MSVFYFFTFVVLYITFNPLVHGPMAEYGFFSAFSFGLLNISWVQLNIFKPASASGNKFFFCTLQGTVLIAGASFFLLHFWKLNHPILFRTNSVMSNQSFTSTSGWQDQWEAIVQGTGSTVEGINDVRLNLGDRGAAALKLKRLPLLPSDLPWASFLRPLRSFHQPTDESRLTVTATTKRTKPYLGLLFSRRMSIQLVNNGFLVTAPNSTHDVSASFVPLTHADAGNLHEWAVSATGVELRLLLDSIEVWKAPQFEPLDQYVIGMPRPDQEHGGSITIQSTNVYRKRYIPLN